MEHKRIDDDDGDTAASAIKIAGKGNDGTKIVGEVGENATKIVGEGNHGTKIIGEGDDAKKIVGDDARKITKEGGNACVDQKTLSYKTAVEESDDQASGSLKQLNKLLIKGIGLFSSGEKDIKDDSFLSKGASIEKKI
uniref:Uncharacterized protein n=1 Tax=Romanomermis culicivorax TaxID=13658 RepID=A0A915KSG9_ROMCU